MGSLPVPQIQDEYFHSESAAGTAAFFTKIYTEGCYSNVCSTQPCWGTLRWSRLKLTIQCVEEKWAALLFPLPSAVQRWQNWDAPQLGKGGGGTIEPCTRDRVFLPPFPPLRMDGQKWVMHTNYRHFSSLLVYFQDNSFKSQLSPFHLFSVAEQLVVRCRNWPFLGSPWEKPHKDNKSREIWNYYKLGEKNLPRWLKEW